MSAPIAEREKRGRATSRRRVLGGAASLGGLSLASILADPVLARAAAAELRRETIERSRGGTVHAWLGVPNRTPAPAIMLVHEWWGLNDQIKAVAREFVQQGYVALAIDLMHGRTADHRNDAKILLGRIGRTEALDTCGSWLRWLKAHEAVNGKLATIGWCFGGGWALSAATVEPVDATVVYYGRVNHPTSELRRLKGPVMGHFATNDIWINRDMVTVFESGMLTAGKRAISHWYNARHAFANPTRERYDEAAADLAWERTLAFLREQLG